MTIFVTGDVNMSKEKKHRYFDPKMKGRAWVVTMHISVLKKIGFTEEEIIEHERILYSK